MIMSSKYTDIPATVQVIGCIYQNSALLDNDNYTFLEEDFTEDFHKILFGSIYNLHLLGAKEISVTVEKQQTGENSENTESENFFDILKTFFSFCNQSTDFPFINVTKYLFPI